MAETVVTGRIPSERFDESKFDALLEANAKLQADNDELNSQLGKALAKIDELEKAKK